MERNFMDYHQDRFEDASMMIYKDEILFACVPGNKKDEQFYSHQGLTYGGFFFKENATPTEVEYAFQYFITELKKEYRRIEWRWQPAIYNSSHNHLLEICEQNGFKNYQAFNNLHINLKEPVDISPKKTVGYRNGKFENMQVVINHNFKSFWNEILEPQLKARHNATPVHSLVEIELLASRFPDGIQQYLVYENDELLAGITFFIKGLIVKTQYASATAVGMSKNANDFIYMEAIKNFQERGMTFMDCGHVNNPDGSINRGLQRFKEQLGAINQPMYRSQWTKI